MRVAYGTLVPYAIWTGPELLMRLCRCTALTYHALPTM